MFVFFVSWYNWWEMGHEPRNLLCILHILQYLNLFQILPVSFIKTWKVALSFQMPNANRCLKVFSCHFFNQKHDRPEANFGLLTREKETPYCIKVHQYGHLSLTRPKRGKRAVEKYFKRQEKLKCGGPLNRQLNFFMLKDEFE